MSDELTPEQVAICDGVTKEFLTLLNPRTLETRLKVTDKVRAGVEMVYKQYKLPLPEIEVYPSPSAAKARAAELGDAGEHKSDLKNASLDRMGACSASWCAHYYSFIPLGEVKAEDEPDLVTFKDFLFEGVYDCILLDERALLIEYPEIMKLDNDGNPHAEDGPAVRWWDGGLMYFWHGVQVPDRIIELPESYDRAGILAITNTEHRRVLQERLGMLKFAEALGATEKDTWTDESTGLAYTLLDCGELDGESLLLLKKQSPVLQTAQQPHYVERVAPGLVSAQSARKWQVIARFFDDPDLAVSRCNEDPVLSYGVET
jgi:hypothetical protein